STAAAELSQQVGKPIGGEVFRDAETHDAVRCGAGDDVPRLIGQRQDAPRVREQALAIFRRRNPLPFPQQERPADADLEPLDLLAHRRLGAVDALAGAGHGILFTTHDPNHALRAADRAYLLRAGERVAEGTVGAVLTRERLEDLYGAPVEKLTDAATGHAAFLPG